VPAVLVVSNEQDVGADHLIHELGTRGVPVVRFNTERSPSWSLSLRPGRSWHCRGPARELRSADCVGVWWRRPEVPLPPPGTGAATQSVADQWFAFLAALATVPGPRWVSDPAQIRVAENKARQLRAAAEVDLRVPETVWTNCVDEARQFLNETPQAVVKPVASAGWHSDGTEHFVYTAPVTATALPERAGLASAPVCFQHRIAPKRDVRVTVVGEEVLAAARQASLTSEPLDWRLGKPAHWAAYDLPAAVAASCRDLVRSLGLSFAGIDFALDEHGEHWFLEVNPNGEWGWLQGSGLPVAQALADALVGDL
jgi:glutathione synthase/RimK-type ligase-like ATP-grasp enzyme